MIPYNCIRIFGHNAVLIEWNQVIDPAIIESINQLVRLISKSELSELMEMVPCYASLTVYFNPDQINADTIIQFITDLSFQKDNDESISPDTYFLPVCYEESYAPDLKKVESFTGLSREEVIKIHTSSDYLLYFIGFIPGFMYLGGLDERLCVPRHDTPRLSVSAGSVGIAGWQTGVYPRESPAGWQIIGSCPLKLFDPYALQACIFKSGDIIRFSEVDGNIHKYLSGKTIPEVQSMFL
jgi:inhibitor of KinA